MPTIVTLYSKPDCHLCDELKTDLLVIQQEIEFELVERNIEDDPVYYERFRYLIPVLDISGGPMLYPPHDVYTIRQTLLSAGQQNEP